MTVVATVVGICHQSSLIAAIVFPGCVFECQVPKEAELGFRSQLAGRPNQGDTPIKHTYQQDGRCPAGMEAVMTEQIGRDLEREVKKEAERLASAARRDAQRDLDALLARAPGLEAATVRTQVSALFRKHGFDAPTSQIDQCVTALMAGERVELSWGGWQK